MRERIEILSDFRLVVRWLRLDTEFQYIYIINPLNADSKEEELKAQLMTIKKQIDLNYSRVSQEHGERNKRLSNSIRDVKDQVYEIRQELKTMREENRFTN